MSSQGSLDGVILPSGEKAAGAKAAGAKAAGAASGTRPCAFDHVPMVRLLEPQSKGASMRAVRADATDWVSSPALVA